MKAPAPVKLKDGDQCTVVGGTHAGKSGTVRDINTSKTGHITISCAEERRSIQNVGEKCQGCVMSYV